MDDMEIEEDDSQEDSLVDGQPNVQLGEAEALARVRSLVGNEVTVDPVDPISPPFPRSMAGHQRPLHTLRVNPVVGSSQPGLVFNSQPSVSSRGAGSAPGMPPRNSSWTGRRGPPAGGQPPAGDPSPWFPRHLGEQMLGRMDQILAMVTSRDEWSWGSKVNLCTPDGGPL